jgi:hypothetical protein
MNEARRFILDNALLIGCILALGMACVLTAIADEHNRRK